jgi:type IV pilus assembly protein PilE
MKFLEHRKVERIRRQMHGFTLMELMIVVAVVGILAGLAAPAYQESGRRAKRSDGRGALLDAATRLERFYSDNNQYTNNWGAAPAGANINVTSEKGHYTLNIIALGANNQTYTLTATPVGFADSRCGNFTLTNAGVQGESGDETVAYCWDR